LVLDFEFDQHLESHKHVINIIMWFGDMGCYSYLHLLSSSRHPVVPPPMVPSSEGVRRPMDPLREDFVVSHTASSHHRSRHDVHRVSADAAEIASVCAPAPLHPPDPIAKPTAQRAGQAM
jgi:hypothetical protein